MNRLALTRRVQSQLVPVPSDIVDNFARIDNATSLGATPTGQTWVYGGNGGATGWAIVGNRVKCNGSAGESVAAVSTSFADGYVQADIILSPVRTDAGVLFRGASLSGASAGADSINRILVRLRKQAASDTIDIYHRGTSNYTLLAQKTSAGLVLGGRYTLKVTFVGTLITVYLDGVSQLTYNTTTGKEAQTQCGLTMFVGGADDDGQSRFDNFRVGP